MSRHLLFYISTLRSACSHFNFEVSVQSFQVTIHDRFTKLPFNPLSDLKCGSYLSRYPTIILPCFRKFFFRETSIENNKFSISRWWISKFSIIIRVSFNRYCCESDMPSYKRRLKLRFSLLHSDIPFSSLY